MVHLPLPRGISQLGHKKHDQSTPSNGSGNGSGNGNTSRRSSPPNNRSTHSLNTDVDQKPLVLKVYVIKVLDLPLVDMAQVPNNIRRLET